MTNTRPLTLREAKRWIGANSTTNPFGQTSKMPGKSYGLDAFACQRGSELAKNDRSPCARCYARRNFYATWGPVIKNRQGHQRAVEQIGQSGNRWTEAMIYLMRHYLGNERWFRWHDSGDFHSLEHVAAVCEVARATPWLSHWVPTHEPRMVGAYLDNGGRIPDNLVIRLSADFIGQPFQAPYAYRHELAGLPTSTTHEGEGAKPVQVSERRGDSVECMSYKRDHTCGNCRACWSPKVKNVSYPLSGGDAAPARAKRAAALRVLEV